MVALRSRSRGPAKENPRMDEYTEAERTAIDRSYRWLLYEHCPDEGAFGQCVRISLRAVARGELALEGGIRSDGRGMFAQEQEMPRLVQEQLDQLATLKHKQRLLCSLLGIGRWPSTRVLAESDQAPTCGECTS